MLLFLMESHRPSPSSSNHIMNICPLYFPPRSLSVFCCTVAKGVGNSRTLGWAGLVVQLTSGGFQNNLGFFWTVRRVRYPFEGRRQSLFMAHASISYLCLNSIASRVEARPTTTAFPNKNRLTHSVFTAMSLEFRRECDCDNTRGTRGRSIDIAH